MDPAENYIAMQSLNVQYVTTWTGLLVKASSDMEIWQGSNSWRRYICVMWLYWKMPVMQYSDVIWVSRNLHSPIIELSSSPWITLDIMNVMYWYKKLPEQYPGSWFNIKVSSYQYRKSHCGDKTILRPSYLHNGISYTGKMTSLYWIGPMGTIWIQKAIEPV